MNTIEEYILKRIRDIELLIIEHKEDMLLFQYYVGQRNILYECLTAHDNKYDMTNVKNKQQ